ncbi:MAG: hypothetical protein LBT01_05855 [Spirochaetaceae bacterium]|jgi:hypothetical protein|nr:hypothetical protein [Spirochaetaceae bacterium]
MKNIFYFLLRFFGLALSIFGALLICPLLSGCSLPVLSSEYRLELPPLPPLWTEVLGANRWHIEWVDKNGQLASADTDAPFYPAAAIMDDSQTPIIAYPYWHERGILPDTMKPCGAIFPLDVEGAVIRLSWQHGVDAVFYRELSKGDVSQRQPQYFDWKRFRELFLENKLSDQICADPWIVDWNAIAQKTTASGFNTRGVSARSTGSGTVDIPEDGPWIGVSPFTDLFPWQKGENAVLNLGNTVDSYFCPKGVLHCKKDVWTFEAW